MGKLGGGERGGRDHALRPGGRWAQEEFDAVEDGPRDHLRERSNLAFVGSLKRFQVPSPVALVDDHPRMAVTDKQEVDDQSADASVAVAEWVDSLKRSVQAGKVLHEVE